MPKLIDHDARRKDFARAAISVIGDQGIDNTRLVDVAREAGVTTGALTHYFNDKDAVLLAALDHLAQGILEKLKSSGDADDLVELSSLILPLDEQSRREWRVWMSFFGRAVGDPALARALLAERTAAKPTSAWSWRKYADALAATGRKRAAELARDKAAALLSSDG
jgi:TetR/AcrR family transcriptional repressor of bet genes